MAVDIVIAGVKENRNTATDMASMVNNILHKFLDKVTRDTASALEESTNTSAKLGLPACDMLTVLVPAVRINFLNKVINVGSATTCDAALRTASAVNAKGRGADGHSRDDNSGRTHSVGLLVTEI